MKLKYAFICDSCYKLGFSPRRLGINPSVACVGFDVEKVALKNVFLHLPQTEKNRPGYAEVLEDIFREDCMNSPLNVDVLFYTDVIQIYEDSGSLSLYVYIHTYIHTHTWAFKKTS
jgi:hypothetical protein